jgi:Protein of unknown function (DUF3306)
VSEAKNPLARWSERKAAARRGDLVDKPAAEPRAAEAPPPPAEPAAEPELLELPALPSIDDLDFHSDFTVFMAKNVPEALRRAALRKLWTSDPVLANLDGLNDYDEDYHLVDTTITAAQTAYQAGRGYLDAAEKKLEQGEEATDGTVGGTDSSDTVAQADRTAAVALSDNDAGVGGSAATTPQAAACAPEPASPEAKKEPGI